MMKSSRRGLFGLLAGGAAATAAVAQAKEPTPDEPYKGQVRKMTHYESRPAQPSPSWIHHHPHCVATQAEAEAGANTARAMTPLLTAGAMGSIGCAVDHYEQWDGKQWVQL